MLDNPDLLLLDISMPRMDGYSFLTTLKKHRALIGNVANMPVIVLTSKDTEANKSFENINLLTHENIKGYFAKPLIQMSC